MAERIAVKYVGVNTLEQKHEGDAGVDLRATEMVFLESMERKIVKTELYVEIPVGYEGQVRPRSGMALKQGVTVINAPGTVDAGYRGEVGIALINLDKSPVRVSIGDRIAQLVICPIANVEFVKVENLSCLSETSRGDGGFGSTGHK